ncbi:hypothetical protein ASG78_03625 [Nostocoides sp. Soil756]|nr:hypothetical protein ASG78_03625 [Tetrasphaera sp. Soil756]
MVYLVVLSVAIDAVLRPEGLYFASRLTAHPPLIAELLVILVSAAPAAALPSRVETAPRLLLVGLLYLAILPVGLVALHRPRTSWSLVVVAWVCALLIAVLARRLVPPHRELVRLPYDRALAWTLAGASVAFTVALLVTMGSTIRLVSPDQVYELRAASRLAAPPGWGYAVGMFTGAVAPLSLALGIHWRWWPLVVAPTVGYLLVFLTAGNRSAVLGVVAVGLLVLVARGRPRLEWVPAVLVVGMVGAGVVDAVTRTPYVSALAVDRTIVAPALLDSLYVDYYSHARPALWQHAFLRFTADIPVANPARVVGEAYFKSGDNANANFLADGYANLGFTGSFLLLVAVAMLVVAVGVCSRGLPRAVTFPAIATLLISLCNMSPLTLALTGGGALLVALLAVARHRVPRAGRGSRTEPTAVEYVP